MISDVISTALFTDNRVNIPVLKQRAYNHRWAVQEADIIPLTAADPDFPIAPQIVAGMQNYLQKGYLSYGPPTGLPEFCEGVAETLQRKRVLTCEADQIFAVNSAASALFLVAKFALNNPGDEALIADPVDFLFERSVVAAGGRVKRFSLNGGGQGTFDPDEIEALITSGKTKLLSICNPHNPLGRVWTRDELLQLADIAVRHNLWIMSDEVWADIVYQPHHHTAIASLDPAIAERTFSIYGFSKSYGLAGLRLGALVSPNATLQQALLRLSQADETAYGVSTLSQIGGLTAYQTADDWLNEFVQHLQQQRNYTIERLNRIPGVHCHCPQGTFVAFPDISSFGLSAEDLAAYLKQNYRVAIVPGSPQFFGPGANGHIRLSFATSHEILREGLDRIEAGLRRLSG